MCLVKTNLNITFWFQGIKTARFITVPGSPFPFYEYSLILVTVFSIFLWRSPSESIFLQ